MCRKYSNDDEDVLLTSHALSVQTASSWIINSGASSHVCKDRKLFTMIENPRKTSGSGCGRWACSNKELYHQQGKYQVIKLENATYKTFCMCQIFDKCIKSCQGRKNSKV